jgi:hypothetical protein
MLKFLALMLFAVGFLGCSSTQTASHLEYPLNSIYSALDNVMKMGIQRSSENRRELTYRPFITKQDPEVKKAGFHDRGVATVLILGDGRPYTLEVSVDIERGKIADKKIKTPIEYSHDHYDKDLAKKLLGKILDLLDRRQRDNNIIDDFKAF